MARSPLALLAAACCAVALAPAAPADEGFVSLFNGKNLDGWEFINSGPRTFFARDGMLVTSGVPTGILRSAKQYENFIFEIEWRHMKAGGNSGIFIWADPITGVGSPFTRAIEVQVLDGTETANYTSHGDVFAIHGARMKPDRPHPAGWERSLPSERRCKPAPEWNHYRIECNDGVLKLAVNGKIVSGGAECKPRKGYICLESEGSEAQFRNLKLKELPSTNPPASEIANVATGFKPIFTGLDLAGWKAEKGHAGHWQAKDWMLDYDGKAEGERKDLWTEREFRNFELVCDWRFTRKPVPMKRPVILPSGALALGDDGKPKEEEVQDSGDSGIFLRGSGRCQVNIWCWPVGSGEIYSYRTDEKQTPAVRAGVTPKLKADNPPGQWNRFVITMNGDRLTVVLNGKTVLDKAQLPDVPAQGPIGLQHHGDPIQFGNILVRELP